MGISSKQSSRKPVRSVTFPCRSVTFPCRSHDPNTDVEKLLKIVKTWESSLSSSNPSAEMICSGVSHLTALYECLKDIFNANLSQASTAFGNHTMKWTDELLDVSVKSLDICGNTTDVISHTKQNLRDLGCYLRRNRGCSTESTNARYIEFKNKLKKDIKGSMASLKQVDNMIRGCPFMVDSENYHLIWVISVFRELTSFTIVIFRFLLEFLVIRSLRRLGTHRWKAFTIFLSNDKVVPEGKLADRSVNELQRLDAALLRCSSDKKEFIQVVPNDIEALEATLESINSHLHLFSRSLIVTRVSILNMLSFY